MSVNLVTNTSTYVSASETFFNPRAQLTFSYPLLFRHYHHTFPIYISLYRYISLDTFPYTFPTLSLLHFPTLSLLSLH